MPKRLIFAHATVLIVVLMVVALSVCYPVRYEEHIEQECARFNVDKSLVMAVINSESSFNPNAKSKKGALGLMQLMPATASWCAQKLDIEYSEELLYEPKYNITLGVYYLSYLLDKFSERDAVCAYNAGEGRVKEWLKQNRGIPYPETQNYLKRVNFAKKIYKIKTK